MGMRTVNDPYGNPSVLVDTVFGTSYDAVRDVANNIDYVKKVANLFDTSDTIVANIHQRYVSAEGQNRFELPVAVTSEAVVTVFVNGKWQSPSVTYTAYDTNLFFNQALEQGDVVDAMIVSNETFYLLQELKEDAEQNSAIANAQRVLAEQAADTATAAANTATAAADTVLDIGANLRKNNFDATRAPLSSDDETQGYAVGSRWQWQGQEWLRVVTGWVAKDTALTPAMFGAVGDGVADDRPAFAAANAVGGHLHIPVPPVRYHLSAPLSLNRVSVSVDGNGRWAQLTDSGQLSWTDEMGGWQINGVINTRPAAIHRLSDRVFVGGAADQLAGDSTTDDGGTSWWTDRANCMAYLAHNGTLLTIAQHAPYAGVFLARGSDVNGQNPIGLGVSVVNDIAGKHAWGGIVEAQHESGITTYCWEYGVKNKFPSENIAPHPYAQSAGVFALWFAGGGDGNQGGVATQPASAGLYFLKNLQSGLPANRGGWKRGIVFGSEALDGTNGSAASTGVGVAISMARRHAIDWMAPSQGSRGVEAPGARITSLVTTADMASQFQFVDGRVVFSDLAGKIAFSVNTDTVGGDYLAARPNNTMAVLAAEGPSTDVDIMLAPKGGGRVRIGSTFTASSDAPVVGYVVVKDSTGTPRKLAVIA